MGHDPSRGYFEEVFKTPRIKWLKFSFDGSGGVSRVSNLAEWDGLPDDST